ncbi:Replication protein A 70 kDa DNA-binding subunit C [Raphanus sativus]|uniref:Replication protein A subunit n=1 Tax=Raphanus sativus TaxID=3726 RepID=A0A6J0KYE1_RAPSA|nr:replication protein A 70 kDa DNA-binding subunit C [Raphanus sativus]KAJ4878152.1 Replication protein A 70 kDa DNA-binding subunit C [Raphanus sativus]
MAANLTAGAIAKMLSGEVTEEKHMTPILQVTEIKLIQQTRLNQELTSVERYKVALSDGIQSQEGMLSAASNFLVKQGSIQIGSILRLTRFNCSPVRNRRIVIVNEQEIIAEKCNIIGNPIPMLTTPNAPQAQAFGTTSTGFHQQQATRSGVLPNSPQSHAVQRQQAFDGTGTGQATRSEVNGLADSHQPQVVQRQQAFGFGTGTGFHQQQPQFAQRQPFGSGTSPPSARPYVSSNAVGYGSSRQEQTYYSRPPPPSMYVNRSPVDRNQATPMISPIAALNPYQSRWTIKVRVTSKGELKHYHKTSGDGKLFSFDLLDADGGEIRVTCFNEVVDRFFDVIVVGNVYLISKGSLKPAKKEYNHLPNDYEIQLESGSTVQQCYEDDAAIPMNRFRFRYIGDIENMESSSIVDLIGIVLSVSPTGLIMRRNGTEAQKKAFQLMDMSGRSVEVTMWGNFCNAEGQRLQSLCDSGAFPVLAVKAGKISEFNGKQVSTIGSSQLYVEPDFPEAREVREWYEREGRNAPCISISRVSSGAGRQEIRKVITQIKDENLGTSEKPDWITVSATISFMKVDNFCYTACPLMNGDRQCSKKVTNNGDGTWRCERCDRCVEECDYRYILQLQLQDHTGVTWATAFQEAGVEIMGMLAKDLYYLKYEDGDEEKFEDIIRKAAFTKYIFKLKVKEETYGDESRVKATVVKAEKLDYSSDTRSLLEAMHKLRTEDANSLTIHPESSNYRSGAFNSSVDVPPRREVGLPAANQFSNDSRPLGGVILCGACGSNGHVFANCPSFMSEPQGQHYVSTQGRNAGRGMPRQHVGSY